MVKVPVACWSSPVWLLATPSKRPSFRVTPVRLRVGLSPSATLMLRVPEVVSLLPDPLSLSTTLTLNGSSVLPPLVWCTPSNRVTL
ncbi:hypothetical protein D3C85_892910 [compost metagenome]